MNLAFVLRRFGGTLGGTEKYAFDLAHYLVSRGHEVHVYCLDGPAEPPGPSVHRVPRAWWAPRGLDLALAARYLPREKHDLVQSFARTLDHDVFRAGGGVHVEWLREKRRSIGAKLLGYASVRDRLDVWLDTEAIRRSRLVICNSKRSAHQVIQTCGKPAAQVRVVRNGVDSARFRPDEIVRERARQVWGVPDGGRVALFLGTGFRRKGLGVAAAAFGRVSGARDRFVVIGKDARQARYRRGLENVLGDRLIFCGEKQEPEDWLPGADALVLPTIYDSAANATLEAMACGVPPVTSSHDGNAEVVPDRRLVVNDPADIGGFGQALEYAWWHGAEMTDRLRQTALEWPVSRNGEAMENIYRELADG